jgi:hypothetical protein
MGQARFHYTGALKFRRAVAGLLPHSSRAKISVGLGRFVPYHFLKNSECLFILSSGRTGSLSTVKLLNTSPYIKAYHEPSPRLRKLSKAAYYDLWENEDKYRQIFTGARGFRLSYSKIFRRIYAEATYMIYLSPMIARLIPKSKFVHLYRHPAAFVTSGMRRGWYDNHLYDKYRLEPAMNDPIRKDWVKWSRSSKILWVWTAVNEYILNFQKSLGEGRFLGLKHEDLMVAEKGKYRKLFEFLRTPCPAYEKINSVLSVKHNAQLEGSFHEFKYWTGEERADLKQIAGETMAKLGYIL